MASGCGIGDQRDSVRLSSVLISAAFEWLLMLLLFFNGLFSYLITKFARFCKLQTPCVLCSRLDHLFGNEKPGFHWELICNSHKSEISSLAYCHVHQKLADVKEMCESCLLSFATEKKSNPETYRLMVGKLGIELDDCIDDDDGGFQNEINGEDVAEVPLLTQNHVSGSAITNLCSCCSVPFRKKSHVKLVQKDPVKVDVREFDVPLTDSADLNHVHHQDLLSVKRENSLGSPSTHHLGNQGFDRLSRVGYSEVKVTSESESENPSSADDGENRLVEDFTEDLADRCLKPEPAFSVSNYFSVPLSDDRAAETLIHPTSSKLDSTSSIQDDQLCQAGEFHDVSLESTAIVEHGLEDINGNKIEERIDMPGPSKNLHQKVDAEFSRAKSNGSECIELVSTASVGENTKPLSSTDADTVSSHIASEPVSSGSLNMDLNDAYRLATSKGSLPSPTVTEIITGRDSSRAYEDLRILITQISAARGLESPWRELTPSPRVQGQGDDLRYSDASSAAVLQNITKSLSIERNESGLESLDGSIVSEMEGESPVSRLKRQVELDRKSMYLLYRELEEERNASGIAANQAMAMITRLQEEKAAMQMEALQYQRMMEEQSEYDQEALQNFNELLTQREKEIQRLESELENYKQRFAGKRVGDGVLQPPVDLHPAEYGPGVSNTSEQGKLDVLVDPFWGLEDEKAYIADCLKKLEKRLRLFSDNGMHVDISRADMEEDGHPDKSCRDENGESSERKNDLHSATAVGSNDLEQTHLNSQEYDLTGGEILSRKDSTPSEEGPCANTTSIFLLEGFAEVNHKGNLIAAESNHANHNTLDSRLSDLAVIINEVSQLNERLKALEVDHDFLEHSVNTLRNGNDGVRFIQEIARHLQELRRIGITRGQHSVE